jgi:hypothetical protein
MQNEKEVWKEKREIYAKELVAKIKPILSCR